MAGDVLILRGDARALPLPDASVDLIVTSPPYYALRSYTDGGQHYSGQVGSERTPAEYVAALIECTREWMRVVKPCGSIFVNLGDSYARAGGGGNGSSDGLLGRGSRPPRAPTGMREKTLMGLPWRYALACTDQLGLILRAEVIWSKPNGLPESVTDRVRRSHEQVFHFTRLPRYYSAVDEIRDAHTAASHERARYAFDRAFSSRNASLGAGKQQTELNPRGKLPGSVWDIPSQPLTVPPELGVDHFAAFPMELPRRIVLGWSPPGICVACGEGRRPVSEAQRLLDGRPYDGGSWNVEAGRRLAATGHGSWRHSTERQHLGYACACPDAAAPTRPATILDPFGGTGTTALIAATHGRTGISIDRSTDYSRLAGWRTSDPAQRASALQVPKPPPVIDGQGELFALAD